MALEPEERSKLHKLNWMPSKIPTQDALAVLVLDDNPLRDELVQKVYVYHQSRWFPVAGGHEAIVPYDGTEYDESLFELRKGAWDHEHCDSCGDRIEAMTLCWVTREDPYVLLCKKCYRQYVVRKPWWRFW